MTTPEGIDADREWLTRTIEESRVKPYRAGDWTRKYADVAERLLAAYDAVCAQYWRLHEAAKAPEGATMGEDAHDCRPGLIQMPTIGQEHAAWKARAEAAEKRAADFQHIAGAWEREHYAVAKKLAAAEALAGLAVAAKDGAYRERDQLVAALSKLFPSALGRHDEADLSWENDWRWIVFISLPTGQASWHIHDSELPMFDHLTRSDRMLWDGHDTAEKYRRVAALSPTDNGESGGGEAL